MSCRIISTFPLEGIEKSILVHGGWVTISHAAHLTGNREILINNAPSTIECLLKRYTRMRTRCRLENNRYLLDILEYDHEYLSSDLFFSTMDSSQDSWQDVVERRCNEDPYLHNGTLIFPLFHFVLLFDSQSSKSDNHFHLILFENHCVSDGRSGLFLINDFLTLATSPNLSTISEPVNNDFLPFLVDLIPRPFGPLYPLLASLGKYLFKRELRKLTHPRIPIKLNHLPNNPSNPSNVPRYYTKFLFSSSSTNLYENLHNQCRLHNVTINGPITACLLLTLHHCFPLVDQTRLKPFEVGVPFDMRSRLPRSPLTKTSVGLFAGFNGVKINRSLSMRSIRFWSLAKQCMKNTLDQLKQSGVPLMMHFFADLVRDDQRFARFARHFPDGRQSELLLSNIGKYPFSCEYNNGEICLRGLHVINNNSVYRTSTMVFVTCVGDGQLDFSLAHEMDRDDRAKEFLDFYVHLIEICADGQRCSAETTLDNFMRMALV